MIVEIIKSSTIMQLIKFKSVTFSILSSLTLLGLSFTTIAESARADLFGDLQRGVDRVNETINTGRELHKSVVGGVENLGHLARSLGLAPQAPSTDIFDIYSSWYKSISPSEKEVVNALLTEYAEDKQLSFSTFNKSVGYAGLSSSAKSKANVIFFKFKEISVVTAPIKDRFLAFAFCLSSESTRCK
jgi:hypothetical protein